MLDFDNTIFNSEMLKVLYKLENGDVGATSKYDTSVKHPLVLKEHGRRQT